MTCQERSSTVTGADGNGTKWRGLLAPLNVSTGDGRRFLAEGVTSRGLPLPLKWQRADTEGHDSSVVVGSLEEINYGDVSDAIDNGWIDAGSVKGLPNDLLGAWGSGTLFDGIDQRDMPRLAEDAAEAVHLLREGVVGPSVDAGAYEAVLAVKGEDTPLTDEQLDEMFWDDSDEAAEVELLFTAYEIAAATLVPVPAFAECRPFEILDDATLTAAVRSAGWSDLPIADRDREWDRTEAEGRIADRAGIGGDNPNWEQYGEAFLYQDDGSDPETKGAYGFPIVDIVDGTMTIVPRAVFSTAAVLQGGMGGTTIPQSDQDAMRPVVESIYERMAREFDDDTIVAPWVSEASASGDASVTDTEGGEHGPHGNAIRLLTAITASMRDYPSDMFDDPQLDRITPVTVVDGRVFGHIATHDVCHVGHRDTCTTAPVAEDGYEMFNRYQPAGVPVPVGRITFGGGNHRCTCSKCRGHNDDHACLRLSIGGAIAHHDEMRTVAWVRAGEDTRLGAIWVSGVVAGDPDEARKALARQKVSGDWRPIGGNTSLVEVLALSSEEPGFPLPHIRADGMGSPMAITAAGVVPPPAKPLERSHDPLDDECERIASLIASRLSRQKRPTDEDKTELGTESGQGTHAEVASLASGLIAEIATLANEGTARSLLAEIGKGD